jgi:hypothetical protein
MSQHARDRCQQMAISTKRAKAIVRHQRINYRGAPKYGNDARIVVSDDSDFVVVLLPEQNLIMTVMPRGVDEPYERAPGGYRLLDEESA